MVPGTFVLPLAGWDEFRRRPEKHLLDVLTRQSINQDGIADVVVRFTLSKQRAQAADAEFLEPG